MRHKAVKLPLLPIMYRVVTYVPPIIRFVLALLIRRTKEELESVAFILLLTFTFVAVIFVAYSVER